VGQPAAVGDTLRHWANKSPDVEFVQCGGAWQTYGEIDDQSDRLAAGLQRIGVALGDNVAVVLPNRIEYVQQFFALAKLGATQVPLNTYLRGEFLHYQIEDSESSTIITDAAGLAQVVPLLPRLERLRRIVLVGESRPARPDGAPTGVEVYGFDELLACGAGELAAPAIRSGDLCTILYTSGTTGMPKGCMISHGYYEAMAGAFREAAWMAEGDRLLTPVKLFHTFGQVVSLAGSLSAGASVSFEQEFHASTFIARAREVGANVLYGVGAMGAALLAQPPGERERDHDVRMALWVARPAHMQEAFEQRYGIRVTAEIFGQTESIVVSISPVGEPSKPGTAGRPSPYFEVRVVDDDDEQLPTGEVGEIVVRPTRPNGMFSGYWRKPQATLEVSRNLWHHTGDYGRFDADGYLSFVDRKRDAIRRRGENVSSFEVEQALIAHPGIAAVAVHGVASQLTEDDLKACIVPARGAGLKPDELFEFFKTHLPYFAIPRYVELMTELPMNVMGRMQKFKLRELGITGDTWDLEALGLVVERTDRR
jgi:crotonobetaine/carnitine-CoA ligase